jgi:hypothetical protein
VFAPAEGFAKLYPESYGPDYATFAPIGAQPVDLRITLNDWFRFDKPGHYSLKIESSRLFLDLPGPENPKRAAPVTTNAVEFDIVPMTEEEEAREIARIRSEARAARSDKPLQNLAYLTGDAAARDQAAQALRTMNSVDLLRFRNRDLVLRILDDGYLKPDAFVSGGTLRAMVALRNPRDKAESSRILMEYLRRISEHLAVKKDRPRMSAAETILWQLNADHSLESQPEIARPAIAEVRARLEESNFESTLRVFWPQLRDPSLIPALERLLNNPRLHGRGNGAQRRVVLDALFDLAPERSRVFVVAELQDPDGLRDAGLLGRISDAELPDMDASLLSRVQALAPISAARDRSTLREQSKVLARFASAAILDDVLRLYQNDSARWDSTIRAHFIAYFLRRQGEAAVPLATAAAQTGLREQGTDLFVLSEIANCYFAEPLGRLLRQRLNSEESKVAATSAYLLSNYGVRDDTQLVEARLSHVAESDTWLKRDLTESLARLRARFP